MIVTFAVSADIMKLTALLDYAIKFFVEGFAVSDYSVCDNIMVAAAQPSALSVPSVNEFYISEFGVGTMNYDFCDVFECSQF